MDKIMTYSKLAHIVWAASKTVLKPFVQSGWNVQPLSFTKGMHPKHKSWMMYSVHAPMNWSEDKTLEKVQNTKGILYVEPVTVEVLCHR